MQDDPNPPVKYTLRSVIFQKYLSNCIAQTDWGAIESEETKLATETLQDILNVMQDSKLSDRDCVLEIDQIFVRNLGQFTEKGMKIRTEQ